MHESSRPSVAIVDYGMGNLFSVRRACESAGLEAQITSSPQEVAQADGVILPGVGAFADAMDSLRRLELVRPLREAASSGKPFLGVCLGMQLLMSRSHEFGLHEGLGILKGEVVRLEEAREVERNFKVPEVGWNLILNEEGRSWEGTLLKGLTDKTWMYFVHSFYVQPADRDSVVSETRYGPVRFCSALQKGNLFACQFHPERSGPEGLQIYKNFMERISS